MALPKQRKLHTSISKIGSFLTFFHLRCKTNTKHCFSNRYFSYQGLWQFQFSFISNISWTKELSLCPPLYVHTVYINTRHLLTVYQTRSSLNICWQMALFEMVQTLILRFANMEKWINSLNLSTLIFRTLQYL